MDKEAGFTPLWPRTFYMDIQFGRIISLPAKKVNVQQNWIYAVTLHVIFSLLFLSQFVKGVFLQKIQ